MKVAVCHDRLSMRAGSERVAMEIAKALDAPIYTGRFNSGNTFDDLSEMEVHDLNGFPSQEASFLYPIVRMWDAKNFMDLELSPRVAWGPRPLGHDIKRHDLGREYDAVFASGQWAHFVSINNKNVAWYCHSPPRFLYDLREKVRLMYTPPLRNIFDLWTRYWSGMDQIAAKNVDMLIVNSENVRNRVEHYYRRDAEVVYPPVNTERFYFEEFGDYWLSVNRITPFKRVNMQLDIFAELPDERLVIVGEAEKGTEYQKKVSERIGRMDNVEWRKNVDDEVLVDLYARCKGTIQTSIDEDFGYVSVETMSSGHPCLAVCEGGFKEAIEHGRTGLLVGNEREEDFVVSRFVDEIKSFDEEGWSPREIQEEAQKYDTNRFRKKIREIAEEMIS